MNDEFRHPTVDAVLAIHEQVLDAHGGGDGIRSNDLLESAVAAPQAKMMGQPLITDGIEMAAAYLYYLCSNHPFVDGNKRVALATCLVFLSRNGLLENERLNPDTWEKFTLEVASGMFSRKQTATKLGELPGE